MMTTRILVLGQALALTLVTSGLANAQEHWQHIADSTDHIEFTLTPTKPTAEALPDAWAKVSITQRGKNQVLEVFLGGLPPNVEFKLFNIQVPTQPFGLSWYDGTVETDGEGNGHDVFVGRFNADTFIVAPGSDVAPVLHDSDNVPDGKPDAEKNPATAPVHTLHIGLWFPSLDAANESGIHAEDTTPFNGKHNAGPLAFSSSDFPRDAGPLIHLKQPGSAEPPQNKQAPNGCRPRCL